MTREPGDLPSAVVTRAAGENNVCTPPTLSQLFQNFPDFNFFGNPNLKPEESTGYDVGFEQPLFGNWVSFGSTYFHNRIVNLIDSNATFTSFANVGLATTEGTESYVHSLKVGDRVLHNVTGSVAPVHVLASNTGSNPV